MNTSSTDITLLRRAMPLLVLLLAAVATAQPRDDRGSGSSDDGGSRRRLREERRQSRQGNIERDPSSSSNTSTASANRYDVLVENNIFLKDRRARPTTSATTQPAPRPLTPEQAVYLTGVIYEEGSFRAYFETLDGSPAVRVSPGDAIAKGRIVEIAIDAVAYATPDGRVTWVEIGHDLTGSTPAAAGGAAAVVSAPSDAPAAPSTPTDPALMSAAERMRQRRQQELNR